MEHYPEQHNVGLGHVEDTPEEKRIAELESQLAEAKEENKGLKLEFARNNELDAGQALANSGLDLDPFTRDVIVKTMKDFVFAHTQQLKEALRQATELVNKDYKLQVFGTPNVNKDVVFANQSNLIATLNNDKTRLQS